MDPQQLELDCVVGGNTHTPGQVTWAPDTHTSGTIDPYAVYGAPKYSESAPIPLDPVDEDGMTPTDFILWLSGVLDPLHGRTPPTDEQWQRVRERLVKQVGGVARARMASRGVYKPVDR